MAIVTLRVPDEVEQAYVQHDPNMPRRAMERQLARWADFSPTARTVLLSDESRKALEKLYGQPIEDQAEFVKWIENLVSIKVGELSFPLSEGQVKRIEGWAAFFNEAPREWAEKKIRTTVDNALGGAH